MIKIIQKPSAHFEPRKDKISYIIFHATATKDIDETFYYLIDSQKPNRVSAHYVIDRNGDIYQLVADEYKAFHAGLSNWKTYGLRKGINSLNDASIGIEFQCPEVQGGLGHFTKKQISAGLALTRLLMEKHKIKPECVLGHSDIAPHRKQDPGPHFPWRIFGRAGMGTWTDKIEPSHSKLLAQSLEKLLAKIGYPTNYGKEVCIQAFKRHYMPHAQINGKETLRALKKAACLNEVLKN